MKSNCEQKFLELCLTIYRLITTAFGFHDTVDYLMLTSLLTGNTDAPEFADAVSSF